MAEQTYLVPRQVTSRFEFVPGWGLWEASILMVGIVFSYFIYYLTSSLQLPSKLVVILTITPPLLGVGLAKGARIITRWLLFSHEQQGFRYRLGSGRVVGSHSMVKVQGGEYQLLTAFLTLFTGKKGKRVNPKSPAALTAQDWMPVNDVQGGLLQRKDSHAVAAIRIEPINLGLKSLAEQARIIGALHEAINSLQCSAQILSMPRPLDLDAYVTGLEAKLKEVDTNRARLLRPYLRYISNLVAGGEAQERRFYILLPKPNAPGAAEDLRQSANELVARLRLADLQAHLLEDSELLGLLHVWSHPGQAAFEKPPTGPPNISTLLEYGGGVTSHGHSQPQAV